MDNICVPLHLDAFALSPDCCDGESEIAPYTQPNYTALRLDSHVIQHDVLNHVDFHSASPEQTNPRLADIGLKPPNNLKRNRMGIHLHWSLPRLYRIATANRPKDSAPATATDATATATDATATDDTSQPVFPAIPSR